MVRIGGINHALFYLLMTAGSYSKFVYSRIRLEVIGGNVVGLYEKLPGYSSGGYENKGVDTGSEGIPRVESLNSITIDPNYKSIQGEGVVSRFAADSTFEIWGVYA